MRPICTTCKSPTPELAGAARIWTVDDLQCGREQLGRDAHEDHGGGASIPAARTLLAVWLLSADALAFEVLLMRLFSIVEWHHFAFMIISLALLGYGASGSLLSLAGARLIGRFPEAFAANAALFGLCAPLAFLTAQAIPFNPLEALWEPRQWLQLFLMYLVLSVPFFFAANALGLALMRYRSALGRVYAADLLGAGMGASAIIAALYLLSPLSALKLCGSVGLLAAALGWSGGSPRSRKVPALLGLGALALPLLFSEAELRPLPYKGLPQALQVLGARVVAERSSPLGLVQVVESPEVPFRFAPGLSLATPATPPEQLGLYSDAEPMGVITRFDGDRHRLAYLDYLSSALPYHLLARPRVLVLGAGGGAEVLQALYHRAPRIDAVELNPRVLELVRETYQGFSGGLYDRGEVQAHVAEARGFLATTRAQFDLIQVSLLDAFGASAAGLHALNESYLYTVEALQTGLRRLRPSGMLAITRWVQIPPRDEVKLYATAVAALAAEGVTEPGRHLAWIRSWKTSTLLITRRSLTEAQLARVRDFCRTRGFDLAYLPRMESTETNRYNLLARPYHYEAARALLGEDRDAFIERYKFNITPATDDRPYFFQFFRYPLWPEALAARGAGGLSLLDLGYLVLVATALQALAVSLLLILAPLWWLPRVASRHRAPRGPFGWAAIYFLAIGFGFMLIEIAFIQKLTLYLAHPLYAVAVVLASFLVFAGLGSATLRPGKSPRAVIAMLGALALIYLALLPRLFEHTLGWPQPLKLAMAIGLIAPLAFLMGRPFPSALAALSERWPHLMPWVWGINGCASVVGAVAAMLIAVHLGLQTVLAIGTLLYGLAACAYPNSGNGGSTTLRSHPHLRYKLSTERPTADPSLLLIPVPVQK